MTVCDSCRDPEETILVKTRLLDREYDLCVGCREKVIKLLDRLGLDSSAGREAEPNNTSPAIPLYPTPSQPWYPSYPIYVGPEYLPKYPQWEITCLNSAHFQ